jgi:hypothetical protein
MMNTVPSRRTPGSIKKNGPRLSSGWRGGCAGTTRLPERGSAMFYILLGVVLFAALAYAVSSMSRGTGDFGASEQAKLQAQAVVDYAQKAKITVQDLKLSGVATDQLSFLKNGDAGYTTAPHTTKVFHPSGGGLPEQNLRGAVVNDVLSPVVGVYMTRMAIEDVGSTDDDVVFSVRGVRADVCARINLDLTGSSTIPSTGANNHEALFVTGASDLTAATCAACAGKTALCVSQTGPTVYTFYSVVDGN